jgi:glycosyltransferase involved in cell wall biosynthesis
LRTFVRRAAPSAVAAGLGVEFAATLIEGGPPRRGRSVSSPPEYDVLPNESVAPAREFFFTAPQDWSEAPPGSKPGVTVILRTRDRPQFLARALTSIGAQTFRDFVICVVNDGGDRSETEDVARRVLPSDVAVEFIHNQTSVGRPAARNLGFAKVDREFFCVHDDDDTWSEGFLATMVAALRQPSGAGYIGVVCDTDAIVESMADGAIIRESQSPYRRNRGAISLYDSLDLLSHSPPISILMRSRALAKTPRNNTAMQVMYDCEWLVRVLLTADVGFVPSTLAFYHRREQDGDELGAARNSVFELDDEFHRLHILMENELLRTDFAAGRLGLGYALAVVHRSRWGDHGHGSSLSYDGVRFIERKAKAYFRRKALRRRIKNVLLGLIARKPRGAAVT